MESMKGNAKKWEWTVAMELAFDELKRRFTMAPILRQFDLKKVCMVEIDASDIALGAVLSQKGDNGRLYPVAFHSRKFTPAEINYEIHDKELLAIVDCFKVWRRYLEGATHTIQVYSDHQNLEYFMTTNVLNRCQARWAQELAGVDSKILYGPGKQNGKPDALSRHSEFHPEKGGGEDQLITMILHKEYFSNPVISSISSGEEGTIFIISSAHLSSIPPVKWSEDFLKMVRDAGQNNKDYREVAKQVKEPFMIEDGILYRKMKLWVPKDLIQTVLELEHDSKIVGHFGQDKTIELIQQNF
jgi:hypothetical protein